jgi:hypothetical protein
MKWKILLCENVPKERTCRIARSAHVDEGEAHVGHRNNNGAPTLDCKRDHTFH